MARQLSKTKVEELDHELRRLHDRVHLLTDIGPKRSRVTAAFLNETIEELRIITHALESLALTPFAAVEVNPKTRKEPKRLDGQRPMPPNMTLEEEMREAMGEGTEG